ncbi:hypothetical protein [Pseudomonas glycinae]|uniref:hypothetical protein n=1 Tax=Pseudomonas glycinae TaxID=1785145 RepID=UPI001F3A7AA2|nr:hypothetical protein [Pseudomonas glycinae]
MNQAQIPLDPEFGVGGVVSLPLPGISGSIPVAMRELNDEKLIVILRTTESQNSPSKVVRLNVDGSVDSTFGNGGSAPIVTPPQVFLSPSLLHLARDGKFLIVGTARCNNQVELAVVRQFENGDMDHSFGTAGLKCINVASLIGAKANVQVMTGRHDDKKIDDIAGLEGGVDYAVQADGNILLCCTVFYGFDDLQGMVIRLNPDGSPDVSFNGRGFVLIDLPNIQRRWNYALAVIAQENGNVVVCGDFVRHDSDEQPEAYLVCYDQNGHINPQFGKNNSGLVLITRPGYWLSLTSMALMPGANGLSGIIALGSASDDGMIVMLTPTGSFNLVFNNGQPLYTRLLKNGEKWFRRGIQRDSRGIPVAIIVSGRGSGDFVDERTSLVTARYQFDGTLNGFTEFNDGRGIDIFGDCIVLAKNKIVVSGYVIGPSPMPGNVLRYLG